MAQLGGQVQRFGKAVTAACAPLGIKKHEVVVSGRGISIPSCGISVTGELSDGVRVWRAVSRMHVASVTGDSDRTVSAVLFEEPFEREWQVARRIALYVAEVRIDAAIDEAVAAG